MIYEPQTMTTASKFFIAGTQRTGTTLIRTSLSSHPDILCRGEVFLLGKKPYRDEGGYWRYARQSLMHRAQALLAPSLSTANYLNDLYSDKNYSAIGFKLMLNHCLVRPYILTHLLELDVKAILVRRRNILKTLVSRRAAAQSGVYHVSHALQKPTSVENWVAPKVTINTATLISDLQSIEKEHLHWESKLSTNVEYLDIEYEQYVQDPHAANKKILAFLGVQNVSLVSDLKKVNPDKLSSLIENYAEVVQKLQNTKYADFLLQS
jgi:LPS sulfotransferase NodH